MFEEEETDKYQPEQVACKKVCPVNLKVPETDDTSRTKTVILFQRARLTEQAV